MLTRRISRSFVIFPSRTRFRVWGISMQALLTERARFCWGVGKSRAPYRRILCMGSTRPPKCWKPSTTYSYTSLTTLLRAPMRSAQVAFNRRACRNWEPRPLQLPTFRDFRGLSVGFTVIRLTLNPMKSRFRTSVHY